MLSGLRDLRGEVDHKLDQILLQEKEINDLLVKYRLFITQVSFKATHLDRSVWTKFDATVSRSAELREEYAGLVIRTPGQLRKIVEKADGLLHAQQELIDLINHSMEGTRFYDEMERAKRDKRQQEAKEEQRARRLRTAKRSLIQALHYTLLLERSGERIVQETDLLQIDPIIDQWEDEIKGLLRMNSDPEADPDTFVARMESLAAEITGVPETARRVRRTREDFQKFLSINQEFAIDGIDMTSETELKQFRSYFQDEIPAHWQEGDLDAVQEILGQIQDYLERFSEYVISEEDLDAGTFPEADEDVSIDEAPDSGMPLESDEQRDTEPDWRDSLYFGDEHSPPDGGFPHSDDGDR